MTTDQIYNVAVLVGSLRRTGFTRMTANALVASAPANLRFTFVEIDDLPLYNLEIDTDVPAPWARFRDELRDKDAVLFVTPEYNRSIPGALKNAIDIGSRPYGHSVWNAKPAAVVSVTPGALGGFGANHHLRQCLVFLNMPAMQQPEAYIAGVAKLFDEKGELISEPTREFFVLFMSAFAGWIGKLQG